MKEKHLLVIILKKLFIKMRYFILFLKVANVKRVRKQECDKDGFKKYTKKNEML